MGLLHRAFLFDASAFRESVSVILKELDAGNAQPLFDRAETIVDRTKPDEWILRLAGAALWRIRKYDSSGRLREDPIEGQVANAGAIPSYEIGYWLFIVLSEFVQRCPGMGYDYSVLEWVLGELGWRQEESQSLFEGESASLLLKPEEAPVGIVKLSDPYWHWMIPLHSQGRGFLFLEKALILRKRLHAEEMAIREFDSSLFRKLRVPEPEAQLNYFERLQVMFDRAMMMFESAEQAKLDLYMSLCYE